MQSFFCLGGGYLFIFFKHSRSEPQLDGGEDSDGDVWKGDRKTSDMQERRERQGGGYFVFCEAPLLLLLFAFFRARMTCNYVWACPKSEVTQITPSFSRGVEMRERKEPTPTPHPMLLHPPNPRRHHIKYHEIISVISMEICLQIINTLPPPFIPFLSFNCAESLSLSCFSTSLSYTITLEKKKVIEIQRKRYSEKWKGKCLIRQLESDNEERSRQKKRSNYT